jgi:hypothetical protein
MTRAVVASVDIPRTPEGGPLPAVALLGFDGSVQLAEPVDGSLEALTDLLAAAVGPGAHVLVDLPLSGTEGPVDLALERAGLPPRFWKPEALDRGRAVAEGILGALEDVTLLESHPWAVLRVVWALRSKRRLAKIAEPAEKPLLDEQIRTVELPAIRDPYTPPVSGAGLKKVARLVEEAMATIGLNVVVVDAAGAAGDAAAVRVTARCRALLGLLVGSLLRRRSEHVVLLDEIHPPLVLLADPFLRDQLLGEVAA